MTTILTLDTATKTGWCLTRDGLVIAYGLLRFDDDVTAKGDFMRPGSFDYIGQSYRAAKAAAEHYDREQDHETARRFWRDADGWCRLARQNGIDLERRAA
ncbi:hypothetical protein [Devosia sp. Leaf64]|uniref:hypothetical protein n=1 Tax=Devosia sp. Leaf64 TaxID=1736229 RepID=UPI0007137370|nr:hypothetical protein [Devosia sp. Leaf64]KQN75081.1 hypothetical protein ASE94_01820 [Devosia sp. Leaf64]